MFNLVLTNFPSSSLSQDPGGTGNKGVRPGSVSAPSCRKAPWGGLLFFMDTPFTQPHSRDSLHHWQLPVFLQPRGRQLHPDHTAVRGTVPASQPHWGYLFIRKTVQCLCCLYMFFFFFTILRHPCVIKIWGCVHYGGMLFLTLWNKSLVGSTCLSPNMFKSRSKQGQVP